MQIGRLLTRSEMKVLAGRGAGQVRRSSYRALLDARERALEAVLEPEEGVENAG